MEVPPANKPAGSDSGTSAGDKKTNIYGNESDKKETEKSGPNKETDRGGEAPKKSGGASQ